MMMRAYGIAASRAMCALIMLLAFVPHTALAAQRHEWSGPSCLPPFSSPWRFRIDPSTGEGRMSASISVVCRANVHYSIALASTRGCHLDRDGMRIDYNIFTDASMRAPLLGCDGFGPQVLSGVGTATFQIYGSLSRDASHLGAGVYNDEIRVGLFIDENE